MSKIRRVIQKFPKGQNIRFVDAEKALIEFSQVVTVIPGGSIEVLFSNDDRVFQVELHEPVIGMFESVIILPQDTYVVHPDGARFRPEVTVRRVNLGAD